MKYTNFTQGRSFLTFPKIQDTVFYLQSFTIPGFSISTAEQKTPLQNVPIPGDKIVYNTFSCKFLVDERLDVFAKLYQWIYDNNTRNETCDFTLHFYNNTIKKFVKQFVFTGGWITQENDINIDFSMDNTEPLQLNVQFNYAYYEIKDINDD